MTVQRPDTRAWDLSRLRDRVDAIEDELADLAVSKVGDDVDVALSSETGRVSAALGAVRFHLEQRIDGVGGYQAADS